MCNDLMLKNVWKKFLTSQVLIRKRFPPSGDGQVNGQSKHDRSHHQAVIQAAIGLQQSAMGNPVHHGCKDNTEKHQNMEFLKIFSLII